ncbi:MAG: DUF4177 domain-containing protein [Saprospiraceae bacterium]|nr:DUF4177 domain-containing protein [Bacteroidia bacterium]NNK89937.1 DUF4177 domain-containing protein [Saprospiraceae bacterium]
MMKYEYKVVTLKRSMWSGKVRADYLEALNEYGKEGWQFKMFADKYVVSEPYKRVELIFERAIPSTKFSHGL